MSQVLLEKKVVMISRQGQETLLPVPQPQFSEEFIRIVQDRAYETLRAYLEKTKQAGAVELLDDIMILSMHSYGSAAPWVKDQMMSEALGQASHHVLSLGGSWGE